MLMFVTFPINYCWYGSAHDVAALIAMGVQLKRTEVRCEPTKKKKGTVGCSRPSSYHPVGSIFPSSYLCANITFAASAAPIRDAAVIGGIATFAAATCAAFAAAAVAPPVIRRYLKEIR